MSGKRPVIQCLPVAPVPITRVLYSGRRRPTRLGPKYGDCFLVAAWPGAEDAQNKSLIVHRVRRIARCLCFELDCQLIRLDLDSDEVATDEVTVIAFCAIREMFADGACDASLDLCRRSSTPTVE
jgi:hypothetical protein